MKSSIPNAKRNQFDKQLKAVIRPAMISRGFEFDGKRVFRRPVELGGWTAIQIVEFQLGIKNLVGRFTGNVGVFAPKFNPLDWPPAADAPVTCNCLPAMWQRLGYFFDPPQSWFSSLLGRSKPERGDYWWEQYAEEEMMAQSLQSVLTCLTAEALPWLDLLTCQNAFDWAVSELARAKRWKESLETPGAEPHFKLRYYNGIVQRGEASNDSPDSRC